MPQPHSAEVYDSMKAAAAGMRIPLDLLKAIKAQNCAGFKGSRIYADEVRKWIDENPEALTSDAGEGNESLDQLKKQLLRQQIRRAREGADGASLENAKRRGELIERKNLEFAIPKCLAVALEIQRRHLPTELYNTVCEETRKGFELILKEAVAMDKNQNEN